MTSYGIGQPAPRAEDRKFLTGQGRYVDDLQLRNQCHAVILYSPHAHARIRRIDKKRALAVPGVVAIFTGDDVQQDQLGGMPPFFMPEDAGGPKGYRTRRPVLVADRVRCVGDRVAMVLAETAAQAADAAALVDIEYEALPASVAAEAAVAPGAPTVWDDCAGNICFALAAGDEAATRVAFERAAHVVALRLENNRLSPNSLEVRCAIGDYDGGAGTYTLHTSSQAPHAARLTLARDVLHIPEGILRVISPDVGGGFGLKADAYPEDALVLWASRRVGRPVKWTPTRSDAMVGDNHGRDEVVNAEMALDAGGKILAIRAHSLHSIGAYIVSAGPAPIAYTLRYTPGVYDVQTMWLTAKAVFTNTSPVSVYRGPGRSEGIYLIERLMDKAAHVLGVERDEIRRRNFVQPASMPYATPTGSVYDSGEFERVMRDCMQLADWSGYEARCEESRRRGKQRGRSVIYYIEHAGIFNERMEVRFDPGGTVAIVAGTHSHGQGHATTYAQLVSDWLGVPFDSIRLTQGDTDKVAFGRGTYAARSSLLGGSALRVAADQIIRKAQKRAAHLLEAAVEDTEFRDGRFSIVGTDRSISIVDVAKSLFQPVHLDEEFGLGLEASGVFSGDIPNYPNGCHVCEVEVDPETGVVAIARYTVIDDVGRPINPRICEGQIHGGIAQGLGQALMEHVRYDPETGQMLSGSFQDYCMPRADDFYTLETRLTGVPCRTNPLGVKGVGESGTIGAPPAIINAVLDALRPLGVEHIDMPATPHRVWTAIQSAAAS
jgi:carbon-monoxide dehydrogenase large subunit